MLNSKSGFMLEVKYCKINVVLNNIIMQKNQFGKNFGNH